MALIPGTAKVRLNSEMEVGMLYRVLCFLKANTAGEIVLGMRYLVLSLAPCVVPQAPTGVVASEYRDRNST